MAAQVVQLSDIARAPVDPEALLKAIAELHALITLDPILGVSPVRAYFLVNPLAKARIAKALDARDQSRRGTPAAYAIVAYDFPFALHQLKATSARLDDERAKAVVCRSARLQGRALEAAAVMSGFAVEVAPAFDAAALKSVFFPATQETVIQLLRLELEPA